MAETFERREMKFLLTGSQRAALEKKLAPLVEKESYNRYTICNIFFDTDSFHLITTSIERPPFKQKLRMRTYFDGGKRSDTYLELKKKLNHIVYKRRIPAEDDRFLTDLTGALAAMENDNTAREIRYFCSQYPDLAPRIFLSYNRTAYHCISDEALRITFDDNIRWRTTDLNFHSGTYGSPVLEQGQSLMEIKVDNALPVWLSDILTECRVYKTTFSKVGRAYTRLLEQKLKESAGN